MCVFNIARYKNGDFSHGCLSMIKKIIFTFILFVLGSCSVDPNGSLILDDLKEVRNNMTSYHVEHRSVRGFGNDRFDVYSFKLSALNDEFKELDDKFIDIKSDFVTLLEIEEPLSQGKVLKELYNFFSDMDDIVKFENYRYMFVELEGTSKLYLYNLVEKHGYFLILVI